MRLSVFLFLLFLLSAAVAVPPRSVLADTLGSSLVPYTGEASNKSLRATDEARKVLLTERAKMANWTTEQWQAWADERFTSSNSADGTTWRDWKKAQIKNASDHTVLFNWQSNELNQPAVNWDADDWKLFVDNIDTDYQSSDRYFCVILPSGQDKGKFLMGRWAHAMYEGNLPERQTWESFATEGEEITSEDMKVFVQLLQMNVEVTTLVAGFLCALIVAVAWRW